MITHRLSTLIDADKIAVLHSGRIDSVEIMLILLDKRVDIMLFISRNLANLYEITLQKNF